ncbi:putative RNA-directed DNA polymerase [Tanacetum coccineum]|uniref:RNA-directed DNA polymerase n=1 Tax=Tanacetum coccineum TaxID=301880 RepID=A0ABQ5E1P5_9ASTR
MPNLVCTHCNMNGHTADRCFELVGYPPNFKKNSNNGFNRNTANSNVVSGNKDHSTSNSFTDDQFKKLMALISDKSGTSSIPANVAVGHPNGTKAVVTYVGSLRLTDQIVIQDVLGCDLDSVLRTQSKGTGVRVGNDISIFKPFVDDFTRAVWVACVEMERLRNSSECKEYDMVYQNKNSLNFFNIDEDESRSDEPCDDERDLGAEISKGTDNISLGDTENTKGTRRNEDNSNEGTLVEASSDIDESAILDENDSLSEGDDNYYHEFNDLFETPRMVPDSSQGSVNIRRHVNYSNLSVEYFNFSTNLNKIVEPKNFEEASKDIRWLEAMNLEMEALNRNGTWVLTKLPIGRKPIGNKWVYKVKYKSSGDVERFKARLVAKGFNQKEGIDYEETFSPVVKIVTVRCVLSLAVYNGWPVYQLDINNAFLYGDLVEDVYMSLPDGYFSKNDTRVCKLVKSLYGLKQAPRKWNEKLTAVLHENGFEQSKNDFSLFTKNKDGVVIILLVYVDDIVVTGNNQSEINKFKDFLKTKFLIKDLGVLRYFLGIEVLESGGNMYLTQRKYCLELLAEFGMLACKPCGTPIESKEGSNKSSKVKAVEVDSPLTGVNNYQKLVGKLIYLTHTRPDICYVVHVLSQFMHAPLQSHLKLAFKVLRYLKNAPGKGISFNKGNDLNLKVYVDSDWAKCKVTRKSVTGYAVFMGESLVSWKSKKQSMLSKSSAEAEYRAMNSVTCEVIWILKILAELNVDTTLPVPLHCDNSSAIQIAANPVFHERTKHFEIELFFLREKVASGVVKTVKVKSADNIADIFTKGLSVVDHSRFCKNLGLYDMFRISLRGNIENNKQDPEERTERLIWSHLKTCGAKVKSRSPLSEYYHKFNALWRQYDSLVNLPDSICENSEKLKEHNQLLKLMQFLMGLDEIYAPIRSIILTTDPIPDVKGECFELVGYPPNFKKNNNNGFNRNTASSNVVSGNKDHSTSNSFTDDQFKKLMALISDKFGTSSIPANVAVEVSNLNTIVGHPNGTKAVVTHMGSLRLTDQIVIHDVLVVPGYEVSLLSVHKLNKDNKRRVIFDENCCFIQDYGKRYVNNNINVCCLSKCIWHNRLGHPSDHVLDILKTKLDFQKDKNDNVCDVCHKAKQTRDPFPLSEHKTKSLGEIVHLDVWGPYKVQSREGYKYFLTVVDDFTRAVWVFLLRGKDEVFQNIVTFFNLVKNQFNKSIKTFRSDNGTEFINLNMERFCKDNGILHQTSCPYTPQQNGIAERKHRHLLNVGRALMFQGGIPLNMWTECILTAVYLINRIPSSVLSGKSPYELVFSVEPNLSYLKVFGCLCFSTVFNDSDKFSSRSKKFVFIGYSNEKKGYKLFSLEAKKVYFSRDVKFYETVFPFKNSSECKEYDMVYQNKNSLNFFNIDEDESRSDEPCDEERDLGAGISTSEAASDIDESTRNYHEFNDLFETCVLPKWLRALEGPLYDGEDLRCIVGKELGHEARLNDTLTNIVIPTFDIKLMQPVIFSSFKVPKDHSINATMYDICIGTTAAPVYLPGHEFYNDGRELNLIDGAVAANNPTAVALEEMTLSIKKQLKTYDPERHPRGQFLVLSLGTGTHNYEKKYDVKRSSKWGVADWVIFNGSPLMKTFTQASVDLVNYRMNNVFEILDCPDNYLRIQDDKLTGDMSSLDILTHLLDFMHHKMALYYVWRHDAVKTHKKGLVLTMNRIEAEHFNSFIDSTEDVTILSLTSELLLSIVFPIKLVLAKRSSSPFFFILVMEGLHNAFEEAVGNGLITGVNIKYSAINGSHLFYADDVIITTDCKF